MSLPVKDYPKLLTQEITDSYLRKNFESLRDFHSAQNQLLNFKFYEAVFTVAEANRKIPHGLGLRPLDIVVTKVTGKGVVTFNYGLFDTTNINVTVTGPCTVRFFAGVYWNYQSSAVPASTDILQYSSIQRVAPARMVDVSASYTLDPVSDDGVIASKAPVIVTLPTSIGNEGKVFTVIKDDSVAANTVTILPVLSQLISGNRKITLSSFGSSIQFYSAGVKGWKIISYLTSATAVGSSSSSSSASSGTNGTGVQVQTASYQILTTDGLILCAGLMDATLPSAVGIGTQRFVIKKTDSSLTNIVTLKTLLGQTIDGNASGVLKLYTLGESVEVVSDGSNYQIAMHNIPSQWFATTTNLSYSISGAAVKSATPTTDKFWAIRQGQSLAWRLEYSQTVAGTSGNGDLLLGMPTGYLIDTAYVQFNTAAGSTPSYLAQSNVGNIWSNTGGSTSADWGWVMPRDSTTMRVLSQSSRVMVQGTTSSWALAGAQLLFEGNGLIPIVGWWQ